MLDPFCSEPESPHWPPTTRSGTRNGCVAAMACLLHVMLDPLFQSPSSPFAADHTFWDLKQVFRCDGVSLKHNGRPSRPRVTPQAATARSGTFGGVWLPGRVFKTRCSISFGPRPEWAFCRRPLVLGPETGVSLRGRVFQTFWSTPFSSGRVPPWPPTTRCWTISWCVVALACLLHVMLEPFSRTRVAPFPPTTRSGTRPRCFVAMASP